MWELLDRIYMATFPLVETRDELAALARRAWPKAAILDLPGKLARVYEDSTLAREVGTAVWRADLELPPVGEAPDDPYDVLGFVLDAMGDHADACPPFSSTP